MLKHTTPCLIVVLIAALFLSGCAMTMTPAVGTLYSDVKGPHVATSNPGYSKVGTAKAESILGLIATGDASIQTAMKNGGIKNGTPDVKMEKEKKSPSVNFTTTR